MKKHTSKKKIISFELENGDKRDFEGDKKDIEAFTLHFEMAMKPAVTKSPASKLASSPINAPTSPIFQQNSPVAHINTPISIPLGPPKVAIALYDYLPIEEGELEISENDDLLVLDSSDPDWWLVKHLKKPGQGLVPMTYVEIQAPGSVKMNSEEDIRRQKEEADRKVQEDRRVEDLRRSQEELERQRQATIPQIPTRPKVLNLIDNQYEEPIIPARPQIPISIPTIPQRPLNSVTSPSGPKIPALPSRPTLSPVSSIQPVKSVQPVLPNRPIESSPAKPIVASRPVLPSNRPKVETSPKKPVESKYFLKLEPNLKNVREWKDKSGKFTVEAEYVGISDGKVQLHKLNGVTIGVPVEKLDDFSISYLRTLPGNGNLAGASKPNVPTPPPGSYRTVERAAVDHSSFTYNGFDWKDWLMKAGIASSDAALYSEKFVQQRLDSSILADIDRDALRAMKITEGDIIRIRKAANLPTMTASSRAKAEQNELTASQRNMELLGSKLRSSTNSGLSQIQADELYARELQNQENANASSSASKQTKGVVSSTAIFEAGNLLQASSQNSSSKFNSSIMTSTTQFSQPPSTQKINNSDSLGLRGSVSSTNDPWGVSSGGLDLKARRQQEETQKNLETARLAIQKANEQARQAAILEEQAKLAKLKQQQNDLALQQAQETARQALLIQQQAAQKLMSAQMEASKPQFSNQMGMNQMGMNQMVMGNGQMGYSQQQQYVARPLTQPLIPTPTGVSNSFVPTGPVRPNNQGFNNNVQTMVTPNGVQKPHWTNASNIYLI